MKKLDDVPTQDELYEFMDVVRQVTDEHLNGDATGNDRKIGFVLLVFPFGATDGRSNYISNGGAREDIVLIMKEQIARFEDQHEIVGNA